MSLLVLAAALLSTPQNQPAVLNLGSLDIDQAIQGWGSPRSGQSVDGNPLKIGGEVFGSGLGTHARSELTIRLNRGTNRFRANVGVDDEVGEKGSVEFEVWLDGKLAFSSGVMHGGDKAKRVDLDTSQTRTMKLIVTDGGDDINYDHADWADAYFVPNGKGKIEVEKVPQEPPMAIAKVSPDELRFNAPFVVGCSPGKPFVFRVPVSGAKSVEVTALPAGLRADGRVISGKVESAGTYVLRYRATGRDGKTAVGTTVLRCGKDLLALTPPMGWNSWNVWAGNVDDQKVRDAGQAIINTGLADYGFQYVNIDDCWEAGRDSSGNIQTNTKFPDMRSLGDWLHGNGLRFGIYSSPGPKTCAGFEGSWLHEEQDAKSYAAWGIDYLKYDWCSYGGIEPNPDAAGLKFPYIKMAKALRSTDRDIVLSLCQYGMGDVWNWGMDVGGQLWRTTGDIVDTWNSMAGIAFIHSDRARRIGPGAWNDPDMMVVGHLGWGPNPRPTRLTPNEQITHVSMWSMLAAPLILGCDLSSIDDFTKQLLMNPEVLEIDQDPKGRAATRIGPSGDHEVWSRPLWDGTQAIALCNRGARAATMSLPADAATPVRDVWKREWTDAQSFRVPAHGTVLLRCGRPGTPDALVRWATAGRS